MSPQSFEKDDDSNGHIDFITAASVRILPWSRNMAVVLTLEYATVPKNRYDVSPFASYYHGGRLHHQLSKKRT